ncbi:NAD-dependent epimerase/dehydratase family protein [Patescibacteria group bacterium]|nr:NAD-dependent epimerase/dehydratase family protein [Patescibacteria group bacterium]
MLSKKMKKVLVTGANGFIGQHLVNFLADNGYEVWAMLRKGSIPGFDLRENVKVVVADLLDKKSLLGGIPKACVVINLAANPYDPVLSYKVNVEGTQNLVVACNRNKVGRLIHISSQATKIEKKGVYAITKLKSDEIVKKSGIKYVILKPSLVYGEGEKGLFNKIKILVSALPLVPVFGNGKTKVNPIYVKDFCKLIGLVLQNPKESGGVYDVGSLESVTYNDIYLKIIKALGKKTKVLHVPVWMGLLGGRIFEMLKMKNPPFFVDNVLGSTQETNCDPSVVMKKYNYLPMKFADGVREVFFKKKVRVAVVGLGKMGLMHLSILSSFDDVEIVALVDSNPKLFKTVKSMGVSGIFYPTFEDALKNQKIDALYVLTPTFSHFEYLRKAVKKNISVFVEKPMFLNKKELSAVEKMTKGFSGVVGVGYTLVCNRVYREIARIVNSGVYGKVVGFEASYQHGEVLGPKKGWMFDKKKSGGGVLMNPGPHLFSVINLIFGKAKRVKAELRNIYSEVVEDEASVVLDYGDFVGKVDLSWSVKGKFIAESELRVKMAKGELVTNGKELKIISNGKMKTIKEEDLPRVVKEPVFNINPQANGEAYGVEDRLFINAVKNKNKKLVISDGKFALDTELMIHQCYE